MFKGCKCLFYLWWTKRKKMPSALSVSLKMSLNLIKTYLLDKSGQKHLISLDKWKSQGFEYSSGRLLNGRAQLNYTLKGGRRNISKFCPHRNKSLICTLFFVSAQFKKGPGRYARIFHICLVWEGKTCHIPEFPRVVLHHMLLKQLTGRFVVLGSPSLSFKRH